MSVIARSMQLLDILAEASSPVTLTELSIATELPLTTVHRLCGELLAEEIIERGDSGGVQIGSRMWDLGRRYARAERLRTAAGRYLHDLYEVTRVTVELTQIMGDSLAVIERIAAPGAGLFDWQGSLVRAPFAASAAGIAVLASQSHAHDTTVLAGQPAIARVVREARATGVARLPDSQAGGGLVIGAAIVGRAGPEGAVAVYARAESEARAFTPSLLVTARRISAALVR